MSTTIACPQCQARFEIADDLADQPVRCQRCGQTVPAKMDRAPADGFQTSVRPPSRRNDDDAEPIPSPRRPTARPAFPWGPIAIVTIGILFLLLATSVLFNVWFLSGRDHRFRNFAMEEAMLAQKLADQQMQAERARAMAELAEKQAQKERRRAERQAAELRAEIDLLQVNRKEAALPEPKKVAVTEWGSLEGRVSWKGELPKIESLEKTIRKHVDAEHVLKAPADQLLDPTWRIDSKTKGVANVCVYLKRPIVGELPIHADDKIRKDPVVMDAPFTVLTPHIVALYPEWFDGKMRGKTGQRFFIKNSGSVNICPKMENSAVNENINLVIVPKKEVEIPLLPDRQPMKIFCTYHPWMGGYAWIFDHPYHAITRADGTFMIPRVPAGMEVHVKAWHEGDGWLSPKDGRAMTLKAGKNVLDFEMKAK